jgi:hypothetical protein
MPVRDASHWAAIAGAASAASAGCNLIVVCMNSYFARRSMLASEAAARGHMQPSLLLKTAVPDDLMPGFFQLTVHNAGPGPCLRPRIWCKEEFFQFSGKYESMEDSIAGDHSLILPDNNLIPVNADVFFELEIPETLGASGFVLDYKDAIGNKEQLHFFVTALPNNSLRQTILGTSFEPSHKKKSRLKVFKGRRAKKAAAKAMAAR